MAKFQKTGVIDHLNKYEGRYDDHTGSDYQNAMNVIAEANTMFEELPKTTPHFPELEEEVLSFWKEHSIYERSLEQRRDADVFVVVASIHVEQNRLAFRVLCLEHSLDERAARLRDLLEIRFTGERDRDGWNAAQCALPGRCNRSRNAPSIASGIQRDS